MTRLGIIAAIAASFCGIAAAGADEVSVKAALAKPNLRSMVGTSSYYGPGFQGRPTADGETFDMHGLTAAHKTLPIPSYARVTNLRNRRSVILRINDRGPYVAGRMLDVSSRVAHLLSFRGGLETVRLDYLGMAGPEGADDQRALMATLKTGDEPAVVAKAKPATVEDGVTVATRSAPALAYAAPKPNAPAAAALVAAVRPVAPPSQQEPLGLAAKLDASMRQLQATLDAGRKTAEQAAKAVSSPFGELVVAPFKSLVEAAR